MILDDLVAVTKQRVRLAKRQKSLDELKQAVAELPARNLGQQFSDAISKPQLSFICEVKQASPSKGQIVTTFDYRQIARDYADAGVDGISVLTEPTYFKGSLTELTQIHDIVPTPLLRKDFTVDAYMIYEAKLAGASAILLIVAILTQDQLRDYVTLAQTLGLTAIVEVHDDNELERALTVEAPIIGINNRNLKNFTVNFQNTFELCHKIPEDRLVVAESGIQNSQDIQALREHHVDAVLIGETMMRADDKKQQLAMLKGVMVNDAD